MLEHTGKLRVRNTATGQYLVAPIDGWGKQEPHWTSIPECAFRFSKAQAQEQCNFLGWHPHRIKATVTRSCKAPKVTKVVDGRRPFSYNTNIN